MLLEENPALFFMLGWMLDLSRMFRIAGGNWVTLQAKLQDQQPKANPASAWAQLRGSRTAAGTVLLHPRARDIPSRKGLGFLLPAEFPKQLSMWPVSIGYFCKTCLPQQSSNKANKKKQKQKWKTFLSRYM